MNNRPRQWFRSGAALSLLLIAAALLALFALNAAPTAQQTGQAGPPAQEPPAVAIDSPLPTPPTPIIIIEPTWTPWPTPIPLPTPTRRPGPTETPVSPLSIPQDGSGAIVYAVRTDDRAQTSYTFLSLQVDSYGSAKSEPAIESIPEDLGNVYRISHSPNGRYTVYMQSVEPGGRPYIYDEITGKLSALFENYSGGSFYNWHPDSRRFLFWIDGVGLMLVDAENSNLTMLTYTQSAVQGATISPNGLTAAYIDSNPPTNEAVWFVSTAGSDATLQFDTGGISYLYPSAWSPDNSQLVYYGNCNKESATKGDRSADGPLCIFTLQTQEHVALKVPFSGYSPVWSPDGQYIAATGLSQDVQECDMKEVTDHAYEKCTYENHSIYLADVKTGDVSILVSGIAPVWSPDGSMIAFLSDRTGSPEIWTVRVGDGTLVQLTNDAKSKVPGSLDWMKEARP